MKRPTTPAAPADITTLAGTYRATCGSHYRIWWAGRLMAARTRAGRDEDEPFEMGIDEFRKQLKGDSFFKINQ